MAATVADLAARALRRLGVAAVAASDRPPVDASANATMTEIATAALQWIGVVAAGEAPEPADLALAQRKALSVHDGLVAQGLVSWGADQTVPRGVAEDYVMLTALHLGPSFGRGGDAAGADRIEQRIRRVSMLMKAPALAEQAVMDVHSALDARGKARWSVFDVPDHAEGPYVALAANLLAPQFGLEADEAGQLRAERQLAQAIALPSSGEAMRPEYF